MTEPAPTEPPTRTPGNAQRIAELQARYDRAMENYCRWRRGETDPYRLAENAEYLRQLDGLRRQLAAAQAAPDDWVSRMRLLEHWSDPAETGAHYAFETPDGRYRLTLNDVTHVWLAHTPDGALEGPFPSAQDAADWAAEDWAETFRDAAP
jgi:hypothetical protein